MAIADDLSKLAELRASGGLTEEEFTRAKERVLHSEPAHSENLPASGLNAFRRSSSDHWFGGVCGGLARLTGAESWVWRLLFTALFLLGGVGLLLYILLWIFVPSE
jgi:phage shock protein PspC (stress-responsive transcriptional regulator)